MPESRVTVRHDHTCGMCGVDWEHTVDPTIWYCRDGTEKDCDNCFHRGEDFEEIFYEEAYPGEEEPPYDTDSLEDHATYYELNGYDS